MTPTSTVVGSAEPEPDVPEAPLEAGSSPPPQAASSREGVTVSTRAAPGPELRRLGARMAPRSRGSPHGGRQVPPNVAGITAPVKSGVASATRIHLPDGAKSRE